ncbi:MAG: metallopeptidase TldD-related protein [Phormidesmis sp.]
MSLQETESSSAASRQSAARRGGHRPRHKSANEVAFYRLVEAIDQAIETQLNLHFTLSLSGEDSQFTRFSQAKIRQTGRVQDGKIRLTLIASTSAAASGMVCEMTSEIASGMANETTASETANETVATEKRTAAITLPFTGSFSEDWSLLQPALTHLQQELPDLPVDPHCVLPTRIRRDQPDSHSREVYWESDGARLLSESALAEKVLSPVQGLDFVGLYAGGISYRAYADSAGRRHWFETPAFTLDYSLFSDRTDLASKSPAVKRPAAKGQAAKGQAARDQAARGQAVKGTVAGRHWQPESYTQSIAAAEKQLALLSRPVRRVPRGSYRTYLAPTAVADLMDTLVLGGSLGESALRQGNSAFGKLAKGETVLSDLFSLEEDFTRVGIPRFNSSGEVAPARLPIIQSGRWVNSLVNGRSAKEYNQISNGANRQEAMRAPTVAPGTLKEAEILAQLGTGLYLSNLHYLNWSDLTAGRITGMTRYACFWVEAGEIVAPIENLRFDDDLYRFLGEALLGLSDRQTFVPAVGTYNQRSLGGMWMPGMLIEQFRYTL